jgi:hypothetical protein
MNRIDCESVCSVQGILTNRVFNLFLFSFPSLIFIFLVSVAFSVSVCVSVSPSFAFSFSFSVSVSVSPLSLPRSSLPRPLCFCLGLVFLFPPFCCLLLSVPLSLHLFLSKAKTTVVWNPPQTLFGFPEAGRIPEQLLREAREADTLSTQVSHTPLFLVGDDVVKVE